MTPTKKNTPVAGQGNEGNEQIRETNSADQPTVTTLRLHRAGRDTGMSYGTEAGDEALHGHWWPVLIPMDALHDALKGPVPVVISPEDVKAQVSRTRRAHRRATIDRRVRERIGELEDQVRAEIEAEFDNQGK